MRNHVCNQGRSESFELANPPPKSRPFLRWAGSKRPIVKELAEFAPKAYSKYIEPFLGSGSLYFHLKPFEAVLGDINVDLINAYSSLRQNPGAVVECLDKWCPEGGDYYLLRKQLTKTTIEAAARFIYLNRFCYNGIYRTNGRGEFNVPKGTRTGRMPQKSHLFQIAQDLQRAKIQVGDFEAILKQHAKSDDFVYLDPPYPRSRYSGEYGLHTMQPQDMPRLVASLHYLDSNGVNFLLSYPFDSLPEGLSSKWKISTLDVGRQLTLNRHKVREALIYNY